jgi:hypothetical protein
MDVLLLRAFDSAGMCLPSRCLAIGIHVTTLFSHLHLGSSSGISCSGSLSKTLYAFLISRMRTAWLHYQFQLSWVHHSINIWLQTTTDRDGTAVQSGNIQCYHFSMFFGGSLLLSGFEPRRGQRLLSSPRHLDRLWSAPSFLSSGYRQIIPTWPKRPMGDIDIRRVQCKNGEFPLSQNLRKRRKNPYLESDHGVASHWLWQRNNSLLQIRWAIRFIDLYEKM